MVRFTVLTAAALDHHRHGCHDVAPKWQFLSFGAGLLRNYKIATVMFWPLLARITIRHPSGTVSAAVRVLQ